jgi:predicted acetyltransferase
MQLVRPAPEHLASYVEALQRGWYPNTTRPASGPEDLQAIAKDAASFLRLQDDAAGSGPPITLADGSRQPRLPMRRRWLWDGAFCGQINLRWQKGTVDLPPHVLGHIGYSLVPWKQGRGYATQALAQMLPLAREQGLPFVELTTDVGNTASRKVIERNGGLLLEVFDKPASNGGGEALRFRIELQALRVARAGAA